MASPTFGERRAHAGKIRELNLAARMVIIALRWSKPLRMDRVATGMAVALPDGRRLSLEYWPGDGAPLVLLHGLLDCAVGWKHLAEVMDRPCYAIDLPGFGDSARPARNRISAYTEDVQAALAALDVHDFTLVGHSLGGAVAAGLAERLRDDVAALILMAPAGFGRIHLAEAIQLPGVRSLVRHGLPLALRNPLTALGVYMAVVGNGHLPDPELVARLRKNAYRWAPGAECANEAITASGLSPHAFYRRQLNSALLGLVTRCGEPDRGSRGRCWLFAGRFDSGRSST